MNVIACRFPPGKIKQVKTLSYSIGTGDSAPCTQPYFGSQKLFQKEGRKNRGRVDEYFLVWKPNVTSNIKVIIMTMK